MREPRSDIRSALEPLSESEQPFAAASRNAAPRSPPVLVLHLVIPYRQWDGPKLRWEDDLGKGKGQVYSRDGAEPLRSCNEVEVAKRLRRVRSYTFWISCYAPSKIPEIWRPWMRAPSEMPAWLLNLDAETRKLVGHATGGIPDVVAWDDDSPIDSALFVE